MALMAGERRAAAPAGERTVAVPAADGETVVERRYAIAIAAALAGVAAFALWVLSRRFGIELPSLIDDWVFATAPAPGPGDMLDYFFQSTFARFRPTYQIWSEVQWHAFGAPQEMLVPNLFAVVRVLAFSTALVVVPGVVAATGRTKPAPALLGGLCLAAGLILFASPATDGSFLSLGSQEPLLVGTIIPGVALLAWGVGRLLAGGESERTWLTWLGLVSGLVLWSFGIYYKEASLVLLAGAPFLYLHLDRRWRERDLVRGPLVRQRPFQLVTAAMLVPVVHVAIGTSSVPGGAGYYGAEAPSSLGGWFERFVDAAGVAWDTSVAPGLTEWRLILPALFVLAGMVAVHRKRIPWLALGCLVTGLAATVFQGLLLSPQPRYLIPGIALFAIAGVLLLADLPPWLGWAAVIAALVLTVSNFREVRDSADLYAEWQEGEGQVVKSVSRFHPETCPVYLMNMGIEVADGISSLVGLQPTTPGPCPRGFSGVVVGYQVPPLEPYLTDDSAYRACAGPGGPELLLRQKGAEGIPQGALEIFGCRRFARKLDGQPTDLLLARSRLAPGVRLSESRNEKCALRYGVEACSPVFQPG
jgi:hypothetical protein